jgi:hypothetical protein
MASDMGRNTTRPIIAIRDCASPAHGDDNGNNATCVLVMRLRGYEGCSDARFSLKWGPAGFFISFQIITTCCLPTIDRSVLLSRPSVPVPLNNGPMYIDFKLAPYSSSKPSLVRVEIVGASQNDFPNTYPSHGPGAFDASINSVPTRQRPWTYIHPCACSVPPGKGECMYPLGSCRSTCYLG